MVRAKFKVDKIEPYGDDGANVTLSPVYTGSPENEQFFRWTPCGEIRMGTINPAAAAQFTVGKEFYVDFTPAG